MGISILPHDIFKLPNIAIITIHYGYNEEYEYVYSTNNYKYKIKFNYLLHCYGRFRVN